MNTYVFTAQQIQSRLNAKVFSLVRNDKGNNEIWQNDISLIGKKHENNVIDILEGWAACNYFYASYRTHSKKDSDGKRKNYGLNGIHDHLKVCKSKTKTNVIINQGHQSSSPAIQSKLSFYKKGLSEKFKLKLKDAELKYIVAGSHSFHSLENDGILELVQVGIDIGANVGSLNVKDIFYGRQTICHEALTKFDAYTQHIRSLLEEPIKQHCVAASADIWTDDMMKRSYLDFTVFFVNEKHELKHTLLRCKHFDQQKTGVNIWNEIEEIFQSFNLSFGDTSITTDQGANMIKALRSTDETRYPCLAHRTNTVLETALENLKEKNDEFKNFCTSVSDLRTYVQQSGGIQYKLPKTLKRTSGARPWRSYFLIHDSLYQSYEVLLELLRERGEQHRIAHINVQLLPDISDLMGKFSLISDNLEFSNRPTLQNVIPSYYSMIKYCAVERQRKNSYSNLLKMEIAKELQDKYWTSTTTFHWIATYLDPSFKDLLFITDASYLAKQKKLIKDGIHILANDFKRTILCGTIDTIPSTIASSLSINSPPPSEKLKQDPFASMRAGQATTSLIPVSSTLSSFADDIEGQIQIYDNTSYTLLEDNNPLIFWREHQQTLPILSKIAKSVYVIQASSAESERHFSTAGHIVTEKRSQLDPECVESLVVLKEAYLNKLWNI
jgi:hypothetical protein